jgi:PHD/YefM family antitoxin component YafN of YafNO toxin-antitoxin module
MMKLHPTHIEKHGKKEFVVLPFDEYRALTELLLDYEDLKDLREAKAESKNETPVSLDAAIHELGL